MAIEFVPLTRSTREAVAEVERGAYQLHTGLYDYASDYKKALGKKAARRYSFLLKDDEYRGYCLASLQGSSVEQTRQLSTLYISDFAVRQSDHYSHYGLAMAVELLDRAVYDDIRNIEFHARGSTSYGAISSSKSREVLLEKYGYRLSEHGGSDVYSSDGIKERFHLMSLQKEV